MSSTQLSENRSDHLVQVGSSRLDGEVLDAVGLRVHLVLDLDHSILASPGEAVLLLPMQSRFEISGGGTCTSIDGRVHFSPEIRGHQIGEARPDWEILSLMQGQLCPDHEVPGDGDLLRRRMSSTHPHYAGVAQLFEAGDSFRSGLR